MKPVKAAAVKCSVLLSGMLAGMMGVPVLNAQDLNLFEAVEGDTPQTVGPFQVKETAQVQNGQPAFTLRSTSRIGDRYHTVLLSRDGSVTEVDWQPGGNALLPGNERFAVVNIRGREVSLSHPASENCINAPELGVKCEGNIAVLSLANSAPVAVQAAPDGFGATVGDPFAAAIQNQGQVNAQGQQVVINPFSGEPEVVPQLSPEEQAARAERQAARSARLRQFEPERIDDSDVPDGMRRVRTPFGDRLVPIRQ